MSRYKSKQSVTINTRAKKPQRNLVDRAAQYLDRSRSEFIHGAACKEAKDVLLDQAFYIAGENKFSQIQTLIDEPLPPSDKLCRLLKTRAPWEN